MIPSKARADERKATKYFVNHIGGAYVDTKRLYTATLMVVLLVCFVAGSAFSQTVVGKVQGYVRDNATNEPLVGVNVIIVDSEPLRGTSTNDEGYYSILNIVPGTYDFKATSIGYQPIVNQGVIIRPDQTSDVNFMLNESDITTEDVVVYGERNLIQADRTSKVTTMSHDDIIDMPVSDLSSLLATQSNIQILTSTPYQKPGYEQRGIDDIRMRGGRNGEVATMVDGIAVMNPLFGGQAEQVNLFAMEQVSIQAGGFDASYGNALSGVINITTREGGNQFSGTLQYNTSRPFGVDGFATRVGEANNTQSFNFSFGGPVPLLGIRGLSFFLSGDLSLGSSATYFLDNIIWDDYRGDRPTSLELMNAWAESRIYLNGVTNGDARNVTAPILSYGVFDRWINPLDRFKGYVGLGFNNNFSISNKLTYRPSSALRFNFTYSHSQRYAQPNLRSAFYLYRWPVGPYLRVMEAQRVYQFSDYTSRTGEIIIEDYPEYTQTVRDRMGLPPGADIFPREELVRYRNWNRTGQAGRNINFNATDRFSFTGNHAIGSNTYYNFSGTYFRSGSKVRLLRNYEELYKNDWWPFAPDWKNVKVKWEYDWNHYDSRDPWENYYYMSNGDPFYSGNESWNTAISLDLTSQVTNSHQVKSGIDFTYLDLYNEEYNEDTRLDTHPTIYRMFPKEGSIYLNDKIDLTSIIINLGTRVDYANAGGSMWQNPLDPIGGYDPTRPPDQILIYNPSIEAKRKFKTSPRFSVSFPLTDVTTVNFNFGHFYQNAGYRDLYQAITDRNQALVEGGLVGNPNLEQEKSVQYELGVQHQIGTLFAISTDLWLKETTNQVGSIRVLPYSDPGQNNPYEYAVFLNNNFGSARGLDVTLNKRYSHYFSGSFNYSFTRSTVLEQSSWEGSGIEEGETTFNSFTANSLPVREQRAAWERPHSFRGNVSVQLPQGFGPKIFSIKPLSSFGINFTYSGDSGWSYTPSSTSSEGIGEVTDRSNRAPFTHNVNARLNKRFTLLDMEAQLAVNVGNVFNTAQTEDPYTNTGQAGYYIGSTRYSSTQIDGFTTNNFTNSRNITFSFRLKW